MNFFTLSASVVNSMQQISPLAMDDSVLYDSSEKTTLLQSYFTITPKWARIFLWALFPWSGNGIIDKDVLSWNDNQSRFTLDLVQLYKK